MAMLIKPKSYASAVLIEEFGTNLLDTFLFTGSLTLLYAPRGVGKTMFSLQLAFALAHNTSFGPWKTYKEQRVLYIDGEMGEKMLSKRINQIITSDKIDQFKKLDFLYYDSYSTENQQYVPNLSHIPTQEEFLKVMDNYDVIILDNYVTLFRPLEKDKDSDVLVWERVQNFLIRLRERDKAVVLIHHSGKSGTQLGTSRKEFIVDNCISLTRFCDSRLGDLWQGSSSEIKVEFEKERHGVGPRPTLVFEFWTDIYGDLHWAHSEYKPFLEKRIRDLSAMDYDNKTIAEAMKVSEGFVKFVLKKSPFIKEIDKPEKPLYDSSTSEDLF